MVFIDVHSHIDILPNIPKAIEDARKAGVMIILGAGLNDKTNREIIKISKKYPEVKACLGIYPIDALSLSPGKFKEELDFIKTSKPFAISEVGLDLNENNEKTLEKQEKNLLELLKIAIKLDVPIIIHSRKAEKEAVELLEKFNYPKVIMHCFSGNFNLIQRIINKGWYLTIPTNVKHSEHFQQVIKLTPIKQLLCETDSPFLHPDKKRDNVPANVIESYKKIAEIKNISLKEAETQIEENFNRLFKSDKSP